MTIVAPDVVATTGQPLPTAVTAHVLAPHRPHIVVEGNNRSVTVAVASGAATSTPVDSYGNQTGVATPVTPGNPATVPAGERRRLTLVGDSDKSAPLIFT